MPANGFNVGRDVKLVISDPVAGVLSFAIKTGWKAEPSYTDITSKGLDGLNRTAHLPEGHKLTFDLDRRDGAVTDYFVTQEANYFSGQTLGNVTVQETITNVDGSKTQYRYTGVSLKLTNAGEWKGDAKVPMVVEGTAQRKYKVA
jgi:hypothetical protein